METLKIKISKVFKGWSSEKKSITALEFHSRAVMSVFARNA